MPAYRFPILVCEDFDGHYTACLVEDAGATAAFGASYADCVRRLKDYLEWLHREEPWRAKPGFLDPQLVWIKVEVRPEYRTEDRRFPVQEMFPVRVPCVRGRDDAGLLLCALPTLGMRFDVYDDKSFKNLVTHYVQGVLEGKTPREMHRFLPPSGVTSDEVIVHVPRALRERDTAPKFASLEAVAEPIGARAQRGRLSRPWERDAEVAALVTTLLRERVSVLLVGESGVGKSAVLAEAVRKVERGDSKRSEDARKSSLDKLLSEITGAEPGGAGGADPRLVPGVRNRFWLTSAARLIAGMQYLGQWEARAEEVIAELATFGGVMCVENMLELVRVGGQGPGDSVGAFLVPYLQRGGRRIVGEVTPAELDALRRLLPGLADLFHVHVIAPFTRQQAVAALEHVADNLRQNLHVEVERGVPDVVQRLFVRFLPYQPLPGQAGGLLGRVFDQTQRDKSKSVTRAAVIDAFTKQTGLPAQLLRDDVLLNHADVLAHFRSRVIGQENACQAAADLVTTFKSGLNDPNRPIGVMLFAGPTGVGKTELARAISQYLFGHGETADRRLLRLDMSEYAGPGAAERLLGDERGGPSELVKRIRHQPFTVVLFDEIEKAAPDVFDVLLGVFDEGRLTDTFGRLSTFRSAVIVMTSNLGAGGGGPFGLARPGAAPNTFESEIQNFFRPEFFNRIDAVITFEPLSESTIRLITEKELAELAGREGFLRSNIRIKWDEAVVRHLSAAGFDPRYGARPLQRTIEALVITPLARLLAENPELRDTTVTLGFRDGQIVLT